MKSHFAVFKDGVVVRTGYVSARVAHLQASGAGETVVVIDKQYLPEDLVVQDGVVRRRADNANVVRPFPLVRPRLQPPVQ